MAKTKDKPIAVIENGAVYILQAGTKVFVKTADICATIGVTNQRIGQITAQGVINKTITPHGAMYNLIDTLKAYCENTLKRRGKSDDSDLSSTEQAELRKCEISKIKSESSIKAAKAVKEQLEARELLGAMHRSEDVAALTGDLIYEFRSALIALPGRLAVDVAGCSDIAECAAIIQKEVYKVMADLSQYKYDSKKYEERVRARQGKDASEGDTEEDS